jgi:hypothetical protein
MRLTGGGLAFLRRRRQKKTPRAIPASIINTAMPATIPIIATVPTPFALLVFVPEDAGAVAPAVGEAEVRRIPVVVDNDGGALPR